MEMVPFPLKPKKPVLFAFMWRPMPPALSKAVGIQLGQIYLYEAVDHVRSLRLF